MSQNNITPKQLHYLKEQMQDSRLANIFEPIKNIELISKYQASKLISAIKVRKQEVDFVKVDIVKNIEVYTSSILFNIDCHSALLEFNPGNIDKTGAIEPMINYSDMVLKNYPEYYDFIMSLQDNFYDFYKLFKVQNLSHFNTNKMFQMVFILFMVRIIIPLFPTKFYSK